MTNQARRIKVMPVNHTSDNPTDKKVYAVIVGDNGEPLFTSQGYETSRALYDTCEKYFPELPIDDHTVEASLDEGISTDTTEDQFNNETSHGGNEAAGGNE